MDDFAARLKAKIKAQGPMALEDFMGLANAHYYAQGEAIGAAGDFITAPEISQVFGELLGLWAAVTWQSMGSPSRLRLVELGPGRGTLMADALRAVRAVPAFYKALELHLVETSPTLRARQKEVLAIAQPRFHDSPSTLPDGPMIGIANEFFDALPIRQYKKRGDGWHMVRVGLDTEDVFVFVTDEKPDPGASFPYAAEDDAFAESCPAGLAQVSALARRVAVSGGAVLIIDYGYVRSAPGDSLQAIRHHRFHPVLDDPGQADLTAHVDFDALGRAATQAGARVWGPVPQGVFLQRLGIAERTQALLAQARPEQADLLRSSMRRLIDPAEMGRLFQVLAVTHPALPIPPGFL